MMRSTAHTLMALLVGCGLVAAMGAAPVAAQPGPSAPTAQIGGVAVKLPVASGDCALERANPTDLRAIELVESLIRQSNELHLSVTNCTDLTDWRGGKLPNLRDYMQVQSPRSLQQQNFAGQEKAIISANCNAVRQQGGALVSSAADSIKKRLEEAQQQALIQNLSLLGALDEDDFGCYTGLLIKGQTEQGKPKTQLCIFATTVLNGKLVYLYHYSDKLDEAEIERVLNERKATAKAYVQANGGHKK